MSANEKTPEAAPHYFLESADKLATRFATSFDAGLTHAAVAALQVLHGPNELLGTSGVSLWAILGQQVFNGMILILCGFSSLTLEPPRLTQQQIHGRHRIVRHSILD